jgi:hypothetical protein
MKHYSMQTMQSIINDLQEELLSSDKVSFEVLNPDIITSTYAGTSVHVNELDYTYRGYKAWVDLAQLLFCKMKTPQLISEEIVKITFEKLDLKDSFHTKEVEKVSEKYGVSSSFSKIHKSEEPAFIYTYAQALKAVKVDQKKRVLNLGVNSGDEFETISELVGQEKFDEIDFTGIDHSQSAIQEAKRRFQGDNMNFYAHDINEIDSLDLEHFDLIISIGTLQSPSINFKPFFMSLVQNYLTRDGAIILGFPNCRWIDGEMVYGAKAPNYSYSEMSIVIKDIQYCKKYLQQKKFRVTITGKDYLFLTATSIR